MSKSAPQSLINLLPNKAPTGAGSTLHKALSYTKFSFITLGLVLLITLFLQILLIISFNLSYNQIKGSLNTISESQPLEKSVNEMASRIKFIKTLNLQPNTLNLVESFSKLIPLDMKLTDLKVEDGRFSIKGDSLNIQVIRDLDLIFRSQKDFSNFNVTQVVVPSTNSPFYTISASADITQKAGTN